MWQGLDRPAEPDRLPQLKLGHLQAPDSEGIQDGRKRRGGWHGPGRQDIGISVGRELRSRLAGGRRSGALSQETKGDAQVKGPCLKEGERALKLL